MSRFLCFKISWWLTNRGTKGSGNQLKKSGGSRISLLSRISSLLGILIICSSRLKARFTSTLPFKSPATIYRSLKISIEILSPQMKEKLTRCKLELIKFKLKLSKIKHLTGLLRLNRPSRKKSLPSRKD